MKTVANRITYLNPCGDASQWASNYTSSAKAWNECERGDWMLWLLARTIAKDQESPERKLLVLTCCDCARLALPFTKDPRVLTCIETTERWANGLTTLEELQTARRAADAAAYAAAADADAYAADAAAYAAAADAAAYAYTAAYAADAAAYAAAYTAATRKEMQKQCAIKVRLRFPEPPVVTEGGY